MKNLKYYLFNTNKITPFINTFLNVPKNFQLKRTINILRYKSD